MAVVFLAYRALGIAMQILHRLCCKKRAALGALLLRRDLGQISAFDLTQASHEVFRRPEPV